MSKVHSTYYIRTENSLHKQSEKPTCPSKWDVLGLATPGCRTNFWLVKRTFWTKHGQILTPLINSTIELKTLEPKLFISMEGIIFYMGRELPSMDPWSGFLGWRQDLQNVVQQKSWLMFKGLTVSKVLIHKSRSGLSLLWIFIPFLSPKVLFSSLTFMLINFLVWILKCTETQVLYLFCT